MQEVFGNGADCPEFHMLKTLLSVSTFDILDECDELLSAIYQLVYAWGIEHDLPARTERVYVLQSVLQALCEDEAVQAILHKHPNVADVQHHSDRGRYGAIPEIRLMTGVHFCILGWPTAVQSGCHVLSQGVSNAQPASGNDWYH
jgi:hypothetical protein